MMTQKRRAVIAVLIFAAFILFAFGAVIMTQHIDTGYSMMSGGIYPYSFIHVLSEADEGSYPVAEITFEASASGTFYYICQYPGHAQEGMYGTIIID